MKLFTLILCVGLSSGLLFADSAEHRPGKEAYTDTETGLLFPAELSSLRKNEVVKNFNPLIGTVIRYSDTQGNCADIYLYTLSSNDRYLLKEDMEDHYHTVIRSILALPERTSIVKKIHLLSDQQIPHSGTPAWRASFQIVQAGNNTANTSWLVLTSIRRHVIKLRFTPVNPATGNKLFPNLEKELLSLCSGKDQ